MSNENNSDMDKKDLLQSLFSTFSIINPYMKCKSNPAYESNPANESYPAYEPET
jgi:hypothetical protein